MNTSHEVLRRISPRTVRVGLLAIVCLLAASAWAAGVGGRPAYRDHVVTGLDGVRQYRTALPDLADLAAEDRDREQAGEPFRFAVPEPVALTPANSGTWESLPGGRDLWRLRIGCPDAVSLNLGFGRYFLTPGAELLVYAAAGTGPVLRFDDDDVKPHGELWTPVLVSDAIVVELAVPSVDRAKILLELSSIGRGYRHFPLTGVDKAGSCNIDVVCPEGDPWRDEIDCVGVYSTGGSTFCTGAMINNTSQDGRPYFLTANHCGVNDGNAASMVVYWNFQSPTCGQQDGGPTDQFQTGATLRANSATSDFKLLELDDEPDAALRRQVCRLGPQLRQPRFGRGHPPPQHRREEHQLRERSPDHDDVSTDCRPPATARTCGSPTGDLGTTERGSSGSPLFNAAHHIVGQLHGGYAACGNDESDWYGRLSVSWTRRRHGRNPPVRLARPGEHRRGDPGPLRPGRRRSPAR